MEPVTEWTVKPAKICAAFFLKAQGTDNFIDIDIVTKPSEKIIREIAHDQYLPPVCVLVFSFNSILEVPYIKRSRFYCKLGENTLICSKALNLNRLRHFNSNPFLLSVLYFFLGIGVLPRREEAFL